MSVKFQSLSGLIVESRKGVSSVSSHGTVRESLPSYGSCCLITNVFLHHGIGNQCFGDSPQVSNQNVKK